MKTFFIILLLSLCSADGFSQSKYIAVTIDDLPTVSYRNTSSEIDQEITFKLIQTFKKYRIPAIGFVNEIKLYKNGKPDSLKLGLLENWLKEGYELGNHSYSHLNYHQTSFEEFSADILKGEKITKNLSASYGLSYRYFRHPFLRRGKSESRVDSLRSFLINVGYIEAPVTIDNTDYIFAEAYSLADQQKDIQLKNRIGKAYLEYMEKKLLFFERNARELFGREIAQVLLLHASLLNADYLDELAEMYQSHNYHFESLETVLKDKAYRHSITRFGDWGISWIDRWALSEGKKGDFFKDDPPTPDFILKLTE